MLICIRKQKNSCDFLYCDIHFVVVFWYWICNISKFCLYEDLEIMAAESGGILMHIERINFQYTVEQSRNGLNDNLGIEISEKEI